MTSLPGQRPCPRPFPLKYREACTERRPTRSSRKSFHCSKPAAFLNGRLAFSWPPQQESTTSRPVWLGGVSVETQRDPLGVVLVIGPANYPLLLPGIQALQALVAGNAVLWKPAPGAASPALALQRMLVACGLDPALLTVLETDAASATAAIRAGVDKVILTGSAATGTAVLHELAETLTPSVMELSGCDAVFILDGADLDRATEALAFALCLNGSATCMAPRRLFVTAAVAQKILPRLLAALRPSGSTLHTSGATLHPPLGHPERSEGPAVDSAFRSLPKQTRLLLPAPPGPPERGQGPDPTRNLVPIPEPTRLLLQELVDEATLYGAKLLLDGLTLAPQPKDSVYPTLLSDVTPDMRIARTDIFAPVLSMLSAETEDAAVDAHNACPYALTTAIFGPIKQAETLAARLHTGTVILNDIIVPTADPRVTFGGRKQSGFGATRGREGLLAMTVPKTILRQASRSRRAYQPTGAIHIPFFAGLAQALHAGSWRARLNGAKKLVQAARQIK